MPGANTADSGLTERQAEVLNLLSQGLTGPQVAKRLGLATSTVAEHLKKIYRKMRVHNRAAAVAKALGAEVVESRENRPACCPHCGFSLMGPPSPARVKFSNRKGSNPVFAV